MIPIPSTVEPLPGEAFVVTPATTVCVPGGDERLLRIGRYLSEFIGTAAGEEPPSVVAGADAALPGGILLEIGDVPEPGDEAYALIVTSERVTIRGRHPSGIFYGVQTLRQQLPPFLEHAAVRSDRIRPVRASPVRIVDSPRFEWRGAMLDVSRHFFPAADVKRYIDLMSLHKLNRLHLHLSDDQGWRIAIESWPNLALHGGSTQTGGGGGGYYSQDEYAAIVAYAADRGIIVVPELDMPGHTHAALASYPELNCDGVAPPLYTGVDVGFSALCVGKEITYQFIDDIVREISLLTPGPYVHVGGDEVKTLTGSEYTQFIERVQRIVQAHGKQMIGWDEIASARLLPTSVVQHWRPDASPAEAVARGAKIIVSVANRAYLDMKYDPTTAIGTSWAGVIDVQDAYDWDPAAVTADLPESALLGLEAPLWSETTADIRDLEFLAFPRLAALAEVAWSRVDRRRWEEFRVRLGAQAPRWSALGINFYRSPGIPWGR